MRSDARRAQIFQNFLGKDPQTHRTRRPLCKNQGQSVGAEDLFLGHHTMETKPKHLCRILLYFIYLLPMSRFRYHHIHVII